MCERAGVPGSRAPDTPVPDEGQSSSVSNNAARITEATNRMSFNHGGMLSHLLTIHYGPSIDSLEVATGVLT